MKHLGISGGGRKYYNMKEQDYEAFLDSFMTFQFVLSSAISSFSEILRV